MDDNLKITSELIPLNNKKPLTISRWIFLGSVVLALTAWIYGYFANGIDALPMIPGVIPGTVHVEVRGNIFVGMTDDGKVLGYAALGKGQGYGGPIEMLVGVDQDGIISGVKIISERETPGFFRLVLNNDLLGKITGLKYTSPLSLGQDLDAVSGATLSSEGVAASIRQAIHPIASEGFKSPLPPENRPIKFGIPEVVLIGLYAAGYFGHKLRSSVWKKRIRWGTLVTGMVVLGFIYTAPFTIAQVISLLSGYWPDWHNNLYWYLLIGGILFVTTVDAKNPYCAWFCPFGAVQECLAQITSAKMYRPRQWSEFFKWLQRGLAFTTVVVGLALRRPGVVGYEPFATLFDISGTQLQLIFLAIILVASLLMYRPFCYYLCPLDPVYDFIAESRRWIREGWQKWQKKTSK